MTCVSVGLPVMMMNVISEKSAPAIMVELRKCLDRVTLSSLATTRNLGAVEAGARGEEQEQTQKQKHPETINTVNLADGEEFCVKASKVLSEVCFFSS